MPNTIVKCYKQAEYISVFALSQKAALLVK